MKTIELFTLNTIYEGKDDWSRPKYKKVKMPVVGKQIDEYCAVIKFNKDCWNVTDIASGLSVTADHTRQKDALAEYEHKKDYINKHRDTEYYRKCVQDLKDAPTWFKERWEG